MKKVLIASALAVFATTASAQGFYAGAQLVSVKLEIDSMGVSADLNGLGLLGGYRLTDNFALEGRYITGIGDDTIFNVKTELESYVGVNLLGNFPLNKDFSLYGSLGYGNTAIQFSGVGGVAEADESSASYGAGLQYSTGQFTVRGGYESLYDKDDESIGGLNLTATMSF